MRALIACLLIGVAACYPVQDAVYPVKQYWQGSGTQQAPGQVVHGGHYGITGAHSHVPLTQLGEQGVVEAEADEEPFFTDTTNLEPVYDFKSKSRYQHGRVVYHQTRYNPTEPLYDVLYGRHQVPSQPDVPQYVKY